MQTVAVHVPDNDQDGDGAQDGDVNISKVEACTHSTNASDDYAHRSTSRPSRSSRQRSAAVVCFHSLA